jgi:hypothetical protein
VNADGDAVFLASVFVFGAVDAVVADAVLVAVDAEAEELEADLDASDLANIFSVAPVGAKSSALREVELAVLTTDRSSLTLHMLSMFHAL